MDTPLDQAITAAAAAEATYIADADNVATIQIAISTATEPLTPAKIKLKVDARALNEKLDALAAAAVAAKVPIE